MHWRYSVGAILVSARAQRTHNTSRGNQFGRGVGTGGGGLCDQKLQLQVRDKQEQMGPRAQFLFSRKCLGQ
jgi:hypothetical protein